MTKAVVHARQIGGVEARVVRDEKTNNLLINHYHIVGQVGQYAMEIFRSEMQAIEPSLAAVQSNQNYQTLQRTSITQSVQRACDGAEAMFKEMSRRGWMIEAPRLDEIVEPQNQNSFGLHAGHTPAAESH